MSEFPLLPGWAERIAQAHLAKAPDRLVPVPVSAPKLATQLRLIDGPDGVRRFLQELRSLPVCAIAIDTEFRYDAPAIYLCSNRRWYDPTTLVPLVLSLAAWVEGPDGGYIAQAVIDLRRPEIAPPLGDLLRELRVPVVCHNAKAELFTLWKLDLDPDFFQLYDTYIAAAALHMGRHHKRAAEVVDDSEAILAGRDVEAKRAHLLSLVGQCQHYGLAYPFVSGKDTMRDRFLNLGPDEPLAREMAEYAAADAEWTLRLYAAQQGDVLRQGLHAHLHRIEFPFVIANARVEWAGIHVDPEIMAKVRLACGRAVKHFARQLRAYGITSPGSRDQFLAAMEQLKLSHLFRKDRKRGGYTTEDDRLKDLEGVHPAIEAFRLHRKYRKIAGEDWLSEMLTGADGRLRPEHRQLGAQTGRNSCTTPNMAGIGKVLRPVVTAPPGKGLFEIDYKQVEVGIAAAVHGDAALTAAYNSTDLYAYVAQQFYWDQLTPEERAMDPAAFKAAKPKMRSTIKTFVLAVLYNAQPPLIAARLGITPRQAEQQIDRFLSMFPGVRDGLTASSELGWLCGYAYTWTGLRRHRAGGSRRWVVNYLRNTPIQGTAAEVFKRAVVELDEVFRGTDARIILPVHDAVVIECDEERVAEHAATAAFVMKQALRKLFPQLSGEVDVNAHQPHCWNKDGDAGSIDRLLTDPALCH